MSMVADHRCWLGSGRMGVFLSTPRSVALY